MINILYTYLFPDRYRLIYPNKIVIIKIFNYTIEFDDAAAKFPIDTVNNIYINTCKHNNSVLIHFSCYIGESHYNYFYSLNNDTK